MLSPNAKIEKIVPQTPKKSFTSTACDACDIWPGVETSILMGRLEMPYKIQIKRLFDLFSQYATNMLF